MRLGGKKAGPPIRAGLLVLFCMGDPDSYRFIGKGTAEKNDSLFPERDIRFLAKAPFRGSWKCPISVFRLEKLCGTLPLRAAGTDLDLPRRERGAGTRLRTS